MTLTERLNVIADLESENLSEELIEGILEHVENPEPIGNRYNTFEELIKDLEQEEED